MSVYTTIERDELDAFLQHYPVGKLLDYEGISAGIENTNYFVDTEQGRFVLTIFESLSREELPFFLDLMAHLAEHDVPSAHPKADNEGRYLRELKQKPAALVQRLAGASVEHPSVVQCAALGKALGHLHVAGQSFSGNRDNERGPHWWHETASAVMPHLSGEEQQLLEAELHFQRQHEHDNLPRGVIHADLFRDNALFNGDELTGLIDFYYACNDVLLYDVAVTVNDWCTNPDGSLDKSRLDALLNAYQQERPLTGEEQTSWQVMLRAGALRFWLSRLQDKYFPREGEITHIKDPDVFKRILIDRATG
ncbi:MAG: homoserine kinase [Gammaproteobacteria bacterium]